MDQHHQLVQSRWDAIIHIARHQRAEHLWTLLSQLLSRRCNKSSSRRHFLYWAMLAGASLVCAIRFAYSNGHIEVMMAAITLASLVSSIAGFAFSAICGAMLFHLSDSPVQVVQIMVICSIANQVIMTWTGRHDIIWRELSIYLAGGACGLFIGVWILFNADHMRYAHALGGGLLAYGVYMFLRKPMVIRWQHPALDFVSGFLGGVTGGAVGFPGAFITIWCGLKGWDKTRQRAVFQPFILIMQVATLLAISIGRHFSGSNVNFDIANLLFIPASLLGTSLGLALYKRLSDSQFSRAVNILLIISGLSYVL